MKRYLTILLVAVVAIGLSWKAEAQIIISGDFFERVSYSVEAQVVDSLSNEPIAYASVYLMPKKDTLITNFSLTDTLGNAVLKEVTRGEYDFHVEFMGYMPYVKSMYIRGDRKLGSVKLQIDRERLEAAKVSAVGEAVEFRQDTIIYNASSFRTLVGDNLSDLLKKMPGIEVGENGDVKVNGKSVSKITVNGKTFFMGDNKAALDNLPATFVNKVKVTEKDSDQAEFTGIRTGEKEAEMDVELKEEYKKGFFGNLKLAGGSSVPGKDDNEFVADRPFLYDASTMLSAYGEKNQVTTIANARNVTMDDIIMVSMYGDSGGDNLSLGFDGVRSTWSVGSNLNSSGIKGMDTNASVMFSHDRADRKSRSDRTTFMEEGDNLADVQESEGFGTLDYLNVNFEMEKKDRKKYTLMLRPRLSYKNMNDNSTGTSVSSMGGVEKNHSESFSSSSMQQYEAGGYLEFGVKDFGKKRRSLVMDLSASFQNTFGNARDISTVWYAGSPSERNLLYDKDNIYYSISPTLSYVEPLGEHWSLNTSFQGSFSVRGSSSDAFNADGSANDYYTSIINTRYTSFVGNLLAQYSKDKFTMYFGLNMDFVENINFARSYGLDTETGKGDWQNSFSPYVRLRWTKGNMSYSASLNSYTWRPSPSSIVPTFNIVNPTRLSLGNIYLKTSLRNYFNLSARGNLGNVRLSLGGSGRVDDNSQVSATWFDGNSIRYSIPVNSLKPQYSFDVYGSVTVPLNKEKTVSFSYSPSAGFRRSTGYQAVGMLEGIDVTEFEYADFMAMFWGDASGNRFYSGESGFRESLTNQVTLESSLDFKLNFERLSMTAEVRNTNSRSTYSLDAKANTNTWRHRFSLEPEYTAPYEITIAADMTYNILRGYGSGYDRNYLNLGVKVQKSIKAFSFALVGVDLLNSARGHRHTVAEDYVQDSYSLTMGRRVLLQFVWNFGKMSAAQGQVARGASFNMMY